MYKPCLGEYNPKLTQFSLFDVLWVANQFQRKRFGGERDSLIRRWYEFGLHGDEKQSVSTMVWRILANKCQLQIDVMKEIKLRKYFKRIARYMRYFKKLLRALGWVKEME